MNKLISKPQNGHSSGEKRPFIADLDLSCEFQKNGTLAPLVCIGGRFKQLQMEVLNVTMKQKEAEK